VTAELHAQGSGVPAGESESAFPNVSSAGGLHRTPPDGVAALLTPVLSRLASHTLEPTGSQLSLTFDPFSAGGDRTWRELAVPEARTSTRPHARAKEADVTWLSAVELADLVTAGEISAMDVADLAASRINRLDDRLNAFITRTADHARARAATVSGGKLAGVPVGLKDLIDVAGVPTTCGSRAQGPRVPEVDAYVWRRLEEEGALLLGKLNTQEFAAGVTSENDNFGAVRNPWHPGVVSGGSSGGSAAAVAAGLVTVSLGTDTGGSVRIPAAFCGVTGFKPTTGSIPSTGVHPLAWSLDQVGPIARSVREAARCVDVLTGMRCEDAAVSGVRHDLLGIRLGVPRDWVTYATPDVRAGFDHAVSVMDALGAELVETPRLPDLGDLTAVNRVIAYAEGSACHEPALRAGAAFGALISTRLHAGRYITATEYLRAQRLRGQLTHRINEAWRNVDLILTPTAPCPSPAFGAATAPVGSRRESVGNALVLYTAPFSVTGGPAISIPCGWDSRGIPLGLQIAGPPGADDLICFVAAAFERGRDPDIGSRRPPCS